MQHGFALLLLLCVNISHAFAADDDIISRLKHDPALIKLDQVCPSQWLAATTQHVEHVDYSASCSSTSRDCFSKCMAGSANHCVGLARHLQVSGVESQYSDRLYALGCQYGSVTACTNRAAGIMRYSPTKTSCYAKSFELTCNQQDAWGCTMYGFILSRGIGVNQQLEKARHVLKTGCKFGIEDDACKYAMAIEKELATVPQTP